MAEPTIDELLAKLGGGSESVSPSPPPAGNGDVVSPSPAPAGTFPGAQRTAEGYPFYGPEGPSQPGVRAETPAAQPEVGTPPGAALATPGPGGAVAPAPTKVNVSPAEPSK